MNKYDLAKAERKWRNRPLFRREPRYSSVYLDLALLVVLLILVASGIFAILMTTGMFPEFSLWS